MTLNIYKPKNGLLLIGIIIFLIKELLQKSIIFQLNDTVFSIMRAIIIVVLVLSVMTQKYSLRTLILCFGTMAIALISSIITADFLITYSVFFICAFIQEDTNTIVHTFFNIEIALFAIHVISSIIFALLGNDSQLYYTYNNERLFTFGFNNPNVCAAYIFNILMMYIWLNYESMDWKKYLNSVIIIVFQYLVIGSRTTFIEGILLLLLVLYGNFKVAAGRIMTAISRLIFPLLLIFFIYICINYKPQGFIGLLNNMLTGRISFGAYTYNNFGFTIFGQKIPELNLTWNNFYHVSGYRLDSIYMNIPFKYGLIWAIFLIISFWTLSNKKSVKVDIIIIICALYGITESYTLNAAFSILPIVLTMALKDSDIQ